MCPGIEKRKKVLLIFQCGEGESADASFSGGEKSPTANQHQDMKGEKKALVVTRGGERKTGSEKRNIILRGKEKKVPLKKEKREGGFLVRCGGERERVLAA